MLKLIRFFTFMSSFLAVGFGGDNIGISFGTEIPIHTYIPILPTSISVPQVDVIITVDWEGMGLRPENLYAMKKFRERYPDIPLLHYLNPAYFTKPGANLNEVKEQIDGVLLPIDQLGLHLHGWKSLFEAATVTHRRYPSMLRGNTTLTDEACKIDCGFEIPISVYSREELRSVIRYSREILKQHGFGYPVHFRSGAWMMSPSLSEALASEGFLTDSSAVAVNFIADELVNYPVLAWLKQLWHQGGWGISDISQPYQVSNRFGNYYEVPDNAALADYISSAEMMTVIKKNLILEKMSLTENGFHTENGPHSEQRAKRTVVLGFHQESAMRYLPRVISMIETVKKYNALPANEREGVIRFTLFNNSLL
ncbi:MAG: hypothetical protein HQK53_10370 [Oligoflexia bacterium]|nr:hypothetical protein [Oligoflexia bacterium]